VRFLRIEAENFRSHEALDLDLSQIATGVIVGPNGSGKSSILRSVEWALFGCGSADNLLSYGEERGGVTVSLDHDVLGKLRISRSREKGKKSLLVVEGEGQTYTRGSINETQAFLEHEVLGMDDAGFRSSVYVPQGEAGAFTAMNAGGRKQLLQELLGLEKYEAWREQAASKARRAAGVIDTIEVSVENLEADIDRQKESLVDEAQLSAEIAKYHERLRILDLELDKAIEQQRAMESQKLRAQLEIQMHEVQRRAEKSRVTQNSLLKLKPLAAGAPQLREQEADFREQQQHEARREAVVEQVRALESQMSTVELAARNVKANQTALQEDSKCPLCGQNASGEHLEAAMGRVNAELQTHRHAYKQARAEAERLRASLPPKTYDADAHARVRSALREAEAAEAKLEELEAPEDIVTLRDEYKRLKKQVDAMPVLELDGPSPDDVRAKQRTTQRLVNDLELQQERHKVAARRIKELQATITAETEKLRTAKQDAEVCSLLASAFSRSGIPALMIESAVDTITDTANQMLLDLGADYRLRLSTQRVKKTGGITDTLDVLVDRGGIERPLENFSGGEKYRVNIALRMGLAAMLTSRAGAQADFLLVDEPTDLDGPGMQALADVLTRLNRQVLLVTHHEELRERFPQQIQVSRASDVSPSRVEVR
jgi:exonuclease SbcC